jgi:hypothetical protein
MKRSETRKRLEIPDIDRKQNDTNRARIYKAIRRKKLNGLEYTYFNKDQFITYLYMMSDCGNIFDRIDQGTVDSLNMILRENHSYIGFAKNHKQQWTVTDDTMYAFEYLFNCKDTR